VERLYPSEAYIALNDKKGKAMADQLTTVSKLRLIGKIGTLTEAEMTAIGIAIKTQLDLV
jgi:mRNA interferase MazF